MTQYQIYYLNTDPRQCAKEHCDAHVKSQCFDIGMLLSYAYRVKDDEEAICKAIYHPRMNVNVDYYSWLSTSDGNWTYLYSMWKELFKEHEFRFEKEHVTKPLLPYFEKNWAARKNYWNTPKNADRMTPLLCKVPEKYQLDHNKREFSRPPSSNKERSVLNSYRNWYDKEFITKESYTKRELPAWAAAMKPVLAAGTDAEVYTPPPRPHPRNFLVPRRPPQPVAPQHQELTEEQLLDALLAGGPR